MLRFQYIMVYSIIISFITYCSSHYIFHMSVHVEYVSLHSSYYIVFITYFSTSEGLVLSASATSAMAGTPPCPVACISSAFPDGLRVAHTQNIVLYAIYDVIYTLYTPIDPPERLLARLPALVQQSNI